MKEISRSFVGSSIVRKPLRGRGLLSGQALARNQTFGLPVFGREASFAASSFSRNENRDRRVVGPHQRRFHQQLSLQCVERRSSRSATADPSSGSVPDRRELRFGDRTLKKYPAQRAPNQTAILAAFEEEGWPSRIDDPLTGRCKDPKKRLGDAVYALKEAQDVIIFGSSPESVGESKVK